MYQSNGYKATKRVCNITKGILIQILNNQEKDPMSSKEEAKECYDDAISQCKYCMKEFFFFKLSEEEKTDILNDISEIQSMMTKLDDIVNDYIEATIIIGDN